MPNCTPNTFYWDEPADDYPNASGLAGREASHDDHGRVTIRGDRHDPATDAWAVWIDIDGDVIETTGVAIAEVR